nr:HAMP domain-containing sensor histidine kinase [uncultured Desulfobulbus sp.]
MEQKALRPNKPPLPSWVINLFGFGLLIGVVIVAFSWQIAAMDRDLQRNTLSRTQMMAAIIEEILTNGNLAATTIDTLTTSFLRDKARFVAYLNGIDPLQSEELEALARETGLLGLSVINSTGSLTEGPQNWLNNRPNCESQTDRLLYQQDQQRVLYAYPGKSAEASCILVGMDAHAILELRQKTALPVLLNNLSRLPGIHYVRIAPLPPQEVHDPVRLLNAQGEMTAEARLSTSKGLLVVGLDAANHYSRLNQLRRQFLLFTALLLGLGFFFSWLLYRYQQRDLQRTRNFERLLAREHEAAALGRATATIAHEVRNPLNAINMGLQRLSIESPQLDADQQQLIDAIKESVRRAGLIITELQRFTRPLVPRIERLAPMTVVNRVLALYRQQLQDQGIDLELIENEDVPIRADADLVAELVENLLRNAIEAQTDGGFIRLESGRDQTSWQCSLTNGGYRLSLEQGQRLGEPYFTTKTRGTGLGLALCRKIAEAHGGQLELAPDSRHQQITVRLTLPQTPLIPIPATDATQGGQACAS